MSNFLKPVPIGDPRLTPDLNRTRSGSSQNFAAKGKRTFDPDFVIKPPLKHVYAELIDGEWNWVNGCDECHGRPGSWTTYIKCEVHDVCHSCSIPRKALKETPWGHPKGFECKPCNEKRKALEKAEALAKMGEHDPWDYEHLREVKCPHCNLELDPDHDLYDAKEERVNCGRCDGEFIVTAEPTVYFTMRKSE
jgi:transcription elongation factor Elf1